MIVQQWDICTRCIAVAVIIVLRRDDDIPQLDSASTGFESTDCDGSGGGGDGHIRTAGTRRAGSAAAVHLSNYRKEHIRVKITSG